MTSPGDGPRRSRGRPRRASGSDGREAIVAAAAVAFAEEGYAAVSMRAVARSAGVDPALVSHYFNGKSALFAASMALPLDLDALLGGMLGEGLDGFGERLVRFFLGVWDDPRTSPSIRGLVRGAAGDEAAAGLLREFIAATVVTRVAAALDRPDAALRAALVGSQLVGLGFARYIVAVPPLDTASTEEIVAVVAPAVQRYLTGP